MILIFLILLVVAAYIYWKLSNASDPKALLLSPLSIGTLVSICLLFACYCVVEQFPTPRKVSIAETMDNTTDTLTTMVRNDTGFFGLEEHPTDLFYHHRYISTYMDLPEYWTVGDQENYIYKQVDSLKSWYAHHQTGSVGYIGAFGLGIINFKEKNYAKAEHWLSGIQKQRLPYVNYYLGVLHQELGVEPVDEYLWKELEVNGEYFGKAANLLIDRYTGAKNYEKLYELLQYKNCIQYFSYSLIRTTYLYNFKITDYISWALRSVFDQVQLFGFVAAFIIALIWLVYLIRLDIFHPDKLLYFGVMLLLGMLSVFGVLLIIDLKTIAFTWEMDGTFFGDMFYAIFAIGIPEELMKILPFLLLAAFTRVLKEPIDYIIYASASALGFAFMENLLYFQDVSGGIIHGRAYLSVVGHMIDSSMVAYGLVLSRFKKLKITPGLALLISFLAGCTVHGLYDFLLFQNLTFLFIIFFIFIVQVWIILINNSLNNSSYFDYRMAVKSEQSRVFLIVSLTFVLGMEYLMVGWNNGPTDAHVALFGSASTAGTLIIFFGSSLSNFNLVKGYWRDIYFSSREKRGYGTLPQARIWISWFFLNSIKAHNYVGISVLIENDPYNDLLVDVFPESYTGAIIDRVILHDEDDPDPHWFLVRLHKGLPLADRETQHVLVKLRYQNDSLRFYDDLYAYFRTIPDMSILNEKMPDKALFESHGWIRISKYQQRQLA